MPVPVINGEDRRSWFGVIPPPKEKVAGKTTHPEAIMFLILHEVDVPSAM